jgi:glycosyltransferase involved in cell wall biosynthesis
VPESKNNPLSKVKDLIKKNAIKENVILLNWVENKELPNYILFVDFVIIPSLAEWFWFAVCEVSALEQNLITTNIASIPEIASWKVSFVEPSNSEDIVEKVIALKNGEFQKIPKKMFFWEDYMKKVIKIYDKIIF